MGTRVVFEAFRGVAPRRFLSLFRMRDGTRKDEKGNTKPWHPRLAVPTFVLDEGLDPAYPVREEELITQFKDKAKAANITLPKVGSGGNDAPVGAQP